jgi:hypothetical protein
VVSVVGGCVGGGGGGGGGGGSAILTPISLLGKCLPCVDLKKVFVFTF